MGKRERFVLKSLFTGCCVMCVVNMVVSSLYLSKVYIHNDESEMFALSIASILIYMILSIATILYNSAVRDNTKS